MNKHTHTQWLREGNTVYALNLEGSNRFVAQVQGGWATQSRVRTDEYELEANARLITAAPELLEALTGLVNIGNLFTGDQDEDAAIWSAADAAARAAIAKATGESE